MAMHTSGQFEVGQRSLAAPVWKLGGLLPAVKLCVRWAAARLSGHRSQSPRTKSDVGREGMGLASCCSLPWSSCACIMSSRYSLWLNCAKEPWTRCWEPSTGVADWTSGGVGCGSCRRGVAPTPVGTTASLDVGQLKMLVGVVAWKVVVALDCSSLMVTNRGGCDWDVTARGWNPSTSLAMPSGP